MTTRFNSYATVDLDIYRNFKNLVLELFLVTLKSGESRVPSRYLYTISSLGKAVVRLPKLLQCTLFGYTLSFSTSQSIGGSNLFNRFCKNFQSWLLTLGFGHTGVLLLNHSNLATRVLGSYLLVRFGSNRELAVCTEPKKILVESTSDVNKQFIRYSSFEKSSVQKALLETYSLYPVNPYTGKGLVLESNLTNLRLKSGKRSKV